jgi:hypothetical protein
MAGRKAMRAFLAGFVLALVLAAGSGLALQTVEMSSAETFSPGSVRL